VGSVDAIVRYLVVLLRRDRDCCASRLAVGIIVWAAGFLPWADGPLCTAIAFVLLREWSAILIPAWSASVSPVFLAECISCSTTNPDDGRDLCYGKVLCFAPLSTSITTKSSSNPGKSRSRGSDPNSMSRHPRNLFDHSSVRGHGGCDVSLVPPGLAINRGWSEFGVGCAPCW